MTSPMYQFIALASHLCLEVARSSTSDGAQLVVVTCTGGSNQLFRLSDAGAGTYTLTNVNSGKCIDFQDATGATFLSQRTCAATPSQLLTMQVDGGTDSTVTNTATGSCLGVRFGSTTVGSPVDHWDCGQTWRRQVASNGNCTPESDARFCMRLSAGCDRLTGTDNCGSTRTTICSLCAPLQQSCAAPNTCRDIGRVTLTQGGTITSSNAGTSPTDMTAAFDGNAATKWFPEYTTTAWIAYQFAASASYVATSYAITSAPDWPDTDPLNWTFEGSNNGNTWTALDTRTNQVFLSREQTNLYAFSNSTAYNRYRLNITRNNGSLNNVHLSEIQIFP